MNLKNKLIIATILTVFTVPAFATTVLTYGEPGPNRGSRAEATKWFAQEIDKRSGGDLKIDIMWGGALFKANTARQSIATGVADMGTIIADYFPKDMTSYTIANLPFDNQDPWVGLKASFDHMKSPDIRHNLAKQNLAFLTSYTISDIILMCKGDAVRTLADLKGKKIRGIGVYGQIFGDLGANLVSMSFYKAYQGLDTGLLDCSQGYKTSSKALKHHEVTDNLTDLHWGVYSGLGIFINNRTKERLTQSQQKVLDEVSVDFIDYLSQRVITEDSAAITAMAEGINGHKLDMFHLSSADSKTLLSASEPYISKWAENASKVGLKGKQLVENYKKSLIKYSKERDEKGYPWSR
tara:strand:- start:3205 stop:4260 length:1056 start_codon:yes stop_codon:yes gene_type:complete